MARSSLHQRDIHAWYDAFAERDAAISQYHPSASDPNVCSYIHTHTCRHSLTQRYASRVRHPTPCRWRSMEPELDSNAG